MNRESQTYPVLAFRQAAQKLGLLRVAKGWVRATPCGKWAWRAIRWACVATFAMRLPLSGKSHEDERRVSSRCLAAAAGAESRRAGPPVMTAIGWMHVDGSPLSSADVRGATAGANARRAGADGGLRAVRIRIRLEATARPVTGVTFARAALRTWP